MKIDNLLITDDHAFQIDGVVSVLKERFSIKNIVACYSPEEAVKCATEQMFDLYILDLGFRSESRIDIRCIDYLRKISKTNPQAKIIVHTMREDSATITLLNKLKYLKGIVLKGEERIYLQEAVETVLKGESYLCPEFRRHHKKSEAYIKRLKKRKLTNGLPTDNDIAIIRMIAAGQTSTKIAEESGHTTSTIKSYRRDLKAKFNVKSTVELILLAILLNFISLDDVALDLLE